MLGLGHDVVDVPAFAKQLNEPGTRMRSLFSMREIWQTAQRSQLKHDDEAVHLAARWAGKEAFLKAWCAAISRHAKDGAEVAYPYTLDNFPWVRIEILDDSHGRAARHTVLRSATQGAAVVGPAVGSGAPVVRYLHLHKP